MRPWQFSKPKGPGFGISANYYLSVLCSKSVLPSIVQIVNPAGVGGAVVGLGAPLASGTNKATLQQPMERGAYVVATRDRKSVLQLLVLSREEASYDPDSFALSASALDCDPELVARVRGTWNLAQLKFESHDPAVYPALDFFLNIAKKIAENADGVIADPISQRYLLPNKLIHDNRIDPKIDARDHVAIRSRVRPDGLHVFTLGMQKFNLPEHEMLNLFDQDQPLAEGFLLALSQKVLTGDLTKEGDQFGAPKMTFEARSGGFDRSLWEGIPVFELLPPTTQTSHDCLIAWAQATGLSIG